MAKSIILTNTETLPNKKIKEVLGVVEGSTVRAKHLGRDIMAGLKHLVGGELKGYTEMLEDARKQSTKRMVKDARALGADAVVNVRYVTAEVMQGAAEVLVYGTAVKLSGSKK